MFSSLKSPVSVLEAADPDSLVLDGHALANDDCDVYGAMLWPSSYAVASSLVADLQSSDAARTRVVELGCGPGLPSLAALAAGAGEVIACDWSPLALELVERAAHEHQPSRAHRLRVEHVNVKDPSQALPWEADDGTARFGRTVLICADMLYEAETARAVARCVASLLTQPGTMAVVADPGRMAGQGRQHLLRELQRASGQAAWASAARFVDEPIAQAELRSFGASLSWCGESETSVGLLTCARPPDGVRGR